MKTEILYNNILGDKTVYVTKVNLHSFLKFYLNNAKFNNYLNIKRHSVNEIINYYNLALNSMLSVNISLNDNYEINKNIIEINNNSIDILNNNDFIICMSFLLKINDMIIENKIDNYKDFIVYIRSQKQFLKISVDLIFGLRELIIKFYDIESELSSLKYNILNKDIILLINSNINDSEYSKIVYQLNKDMEFNRIFKMIFNHYYFNIYKYYNSDEYELMFESYLGYTDNDFNNLFLINNETFNEYIKLYRSINNIFEKYSSDNRIIMKNKYIIKGLFNAIGNYLRKNNDKSTYIRKLKENDLKLEEFKKYYNKLSNKVLYVGNDIMNISYKYFLDLFSTGNAEWKVYFNEINIY